MLEAPSPYSPLQTPGNSFHLSLGPFLHMFERLSSSIFSHQTTRSSASQVRRISSGTLASSLRTSDRHSTLLTTPPSY